ERDVLRRTVGRQHAPMRRDRAVLARGDPDAPARRYADVVCDERRRDVALEPRAPRIAYVHDRELRRRGAERDVQRAPVGREREVARPELQLDAADDDAARKIDARKLDACRVDDERVASVVRAHGVARLLKSLNLTADAELVDDADRADGGVSDDGDAA